VEHSFASATILLLLITDPLGNIPLFANALKAVPQARRARVIVREVLIAFAVLLGFMFAGEGFLSALGLSEVSLLIGGALVLFLIALRMIFRRPRRQRQSTRASRSSCRWPSPPWLAPRPWPPCGCWSGKARCA
jgi:small neutral amino acid transporter SnatA (MarC family)